MGSPRNVAAPGSFRAEREIMARSQAVSGAVLFAGLILGLAATASAGDQTAPGSVDIEAEAVDSTTLDAQSTGEPGSAAVGSPAELLPATAAPSLDQPSLISAQGGITPGAVSSSSLQATVAGGAVSLD